MEDLKSKQVFIPIPKKELLIVPNSFVHANLIPKDTSKFTLLYVGDNPDEVLKDVDTILYETDCIVISHSQLSNLCVRLYKYIDTLKKEDKLKNDLEDIIYDYLFTPAPTKRESYSGGIWEQLSGSVRTSSTSFGRFVTGIDPIDTISSPQPIPSQQYSDEFLESLEMVNHATAMNLNNAYPNREERQEASSLFNTFIYYNGTWRKLPR
jgi:hypothetical protein